MSPDSTRLKKSSTEVFRGMKLDEGMDEPYELDVPDIDVETIKSPPIPMMAGYDTLAIVGMPTPELAWLMLFMPPLDNASGRPSARLCRATRGGKGDRFIQWVRVGVRVGVNVERKII